MRGAAPGFAILVLTGGGTTRTLMGLAGRAILNVRLVPAAADGAAARDRAAVQAPIAARSPVEDLTCWRAGAGACLQLRLPQFRGSPLDRLERHCFAARDGILAQATVFWDHPPPDAVAILDAWTTSLALADRPVTPPAELLAFGRALLAVDDRRADAARFLDAAAVRWRELSPADRRRLGVACTDGWLGLGRAADAERLLGELLAAGADGHLSFCRARVAAVDGRLDDWEGHVRAAFAAPTDPEAQLPAPREEPAFYAVPAARFEAVLRAAGRSA